MHPSKSGNRRIVLNSQFPTLPPNVHRAVHTARREMQTVKRPGKAGNFAIVTM
jgi:hypothetical protein